MRRGAINIEIAHRVTISLNVIASQRQSVWRIFIRDADQGRRRKFNLRHAQKDWQRGFCRHQPDHQHRQPLLQSDFLAAEQIVKQGIAAINRQQNIIKLRTEADLAGLDAVADKTKIIEVQERSLTQLLDLQRDKLKLVTVAYQDVTQSKGTNSAAKQLETSMEYERLALSTFWVRSSRRVAAICLAGCVIYLTSTTRRNFYGRWGWAAATSATSKIQRGNRKSFLTVYNDVTLTFAAVKETTSWKFLLIRDMAAHVTKTSRSATFY